MSVVATIPVSAIGRRQRVGPRDAHAFRTVHGEHVLVVDGSRIYDVDEGFDSALTTASSQGKERSLLDELGFVRQPAIERHVDTPRVNALALAVSEHCNLGCGYCYADGGGFGSDPEHMPWDVARASVERLLGDAAPGSTASLAFLGGEPLMNRGVLRQAVELAETLSSQRGVTMRFAITTNATLLTEEDAAFLAAHGFMVTVSIDGERELHDSLRPTLGGTGSYERILLRLKPLLALQGQTPAIKGRAPMQVTARMTVTARHRHLRESVEHLIALGFHSVGVSPSLSSRDASLQLSASDIEALLAQMVDCAEAFEDHVLRGERYPFSNMLAAMQELHRGTHRPFPCGAGAGYLGVSAQGELSACHRFVGDERAAMGHVVDGIDDAARGRWLDERHVDGQEPCRSCWARYLCGGGCHHEVLHRGRVACDFIRGWLHHALGAYVRIAEAKPAYFS